MLVITRRAGESVFIGQNITVPVTQVKCWQDVPGCRLEQGVRLEVKP